jgi:hypothetical protein
LDAVARRPNKACEAEHTGRVEQDEASQQKLGSMSGEQQQFKPDRNRRHEQPEQSTRERRDGSVDVHRILGCRQAEARIPASVHRDFAIFGEALGQGHQGRLSWQAHSFNARALHGIGSRIRKASAEQSKQPVCWALSRTSAKATDSFLGPPAGPPVAPSVQFGGVSAPAERVAASVRDPCDEEFRQPPRALSSADKPPLRRAWRPDSTSKQFLRAAFSSSTRRSKPLVAVPRYRPTFLRKEGASSSLPGAATNRQSCGASCRHLQDAPR